MLGLSLVLKNSSSPKNLYADSRFFIMGAPPNGKKPIGYKPIALDGGYGWFVVLGSFLIHVFTDGFVYSFGVIAESLVEVRKSGG